MVGGSPEDSFRGTLDEQEANDSVRPVEAEGGKRGWGQRSGRRHIGRGALCGRGRHRSRRWLGRRRRRRAVWRGERIDRRDGCGARGGSGCCGGGGCRGGRAGPRRLAAARSGGWCGAGRAPPACDPGALSGQRGPDQEDHAGEHQGDGVPTEGDRDDSQDVDAGEEGIPQAPEPVDIRSLFRLGGVGAVGSEPRPSRDRRSRVVVGAGGAASGAGGWGAGLQAADGLQPRRVARRLARVDRGT